MPLPLIEPPLINSADQWAITLEDLQALFDCPHTGAVTVRTSLLNGFERDPAVHQYAFFHVDDHKVGVADSHASPSSSGSLNKNGYSPVPPALSSASGAGVGGMAGAPLALGNVRTIRTMLDQHEQLKDVAIIGVGGVSDNAAYKRMQQVGAAVVGVGTALGRLGVGVFESILAK